MRQESAGNLAFMFVIIKHPEIGWGYSHVGMCFHILECMLSGSLVVHFNPVIKHHYQDDQLFRTILLHLNCLSSVAA